MSCFFKADSSSMARYRLFCLTSNPIGKASWTDMPALLGRDAIVITSWWNAPEVLTAVEAKFAITEPLPTIRMNMMGVPRTKLEVLLAHSLLTGAYK